MYDEERAANVDIRVYKAPAGQLDNSNKTHILLQTISLVEAHAVYMAEARLRYEMNVY